MPLWMFFCFCGRKNKKEDDFFILWMKIFRFLSTKIYENYSKIFFKYFLYAIVDIFIRKGGKTGQYLPKIKGITGQK